MDRIQNTACISYFSAAVMKYYDQKQLNEESLLFGLWRQRQRRRCGREGLACHGGRSRKPAGHISIHAQETEREQEVE